MTEEQTLDIILIWVRLLFVMNCVTIFMLTVNMK